MSELSLAAIILAAGKSTRMQSDLPKVLHQVCDRPMLSYAIQACREAGIDRILIVVGHQKDRVRQMFGDDPHLEWVEQKQQLGTGHAVSVCEPALGRFRGDVLVVAGDMPLIRGETIRRLLDSHRQANAHASLATTVLERPDGYGRIIRDTDDNFEGIVEHKNCTEDELRIHEVNPSYYCFARDALFEALQQLKPDEDKGEYFITDVYGWLKDTRHTVVCVGGVPPEEAMGVNSPADLQAVDAMMRRRTASS